MRIEQCFVEAYQGHRWMFKGLYDGTYVMEDTCEEFPSMQMSEDQAEILSNQLGMLQLYQNEDQKNMLKLNFILNYVRENKDIDKEIIIALIENIGEYL